VVIGDWIGDVLLAPQKFNSCPLPFSKPRQFPNSGEAGNPTSKVASHDMNPSSPGESCLPLLRRVRPALAKVGAEAGGKLVRMESVKLTAVGVDEITGQLDDHVSKRLNALSWWGLPNISSISVDQSPESFDVSESWRDDVLPNELE
jgi:hypothetical protein